MNRACDELRSLPEEHAAISSALVRARISAQALPEFPGLLPRSFDEAYDIQDASRACWPDRVAGWKIGGVPPAYFDRFDARSLAGPVFERNVSAGREAGRSRMAVFKGGFAAIEPEFVLRLGKDRDADRVFIGAEIASSPVSDINGYGPVAVICDFGNNNGLVLGTEIADWRGFDKAIWVETVIGGKSVGVKEVTDVRSEIVAARSFLFELAETRGFPLQPGAFVSCGAITGVHEASVGAQSSVHFGGLGTLEIELVAATPLP